MNKEMLLEWLLGESEAKGDEHYAYAEGMDLNEMLIDLAPRNQVTALPKLPSKPEQMIRVLREHFQDNVTLISLVLSHYFPRKYLFYRVSSLEQEIFEGFAFFAELVPLLDLPFSSIGRKGVDRYLELNGRLLAVADAAWPDIENPRKRLLYFLYEGLGQLFLQRSDYHRYWIMGTQEAYFADLDTYSVLGWSGRKEMQVGDLVFMYRMAPRKAITDVYQVADLPLFDPWSKWEYGVELEHVCQIKDIPFAEMRQDPVLSQWGTVRKQFQGTRTDPLPHSVYNRLLDFIPEPLREEHNLQPELLASMGQAGLFTSEADFEDEVVVPLLQQWRVRYHQQYPCHFHLGSQDYHGRIDFYVSDERGPLTLFEDKLQIRTEAELLKAVNQAKSYSLMLGLPSFVVAAPEGLWLYSLNRHEPQLEQEIVGNELSTHEESLRQALLTIRDRANRGR